MQKAAALLLGALLLVPGLSNGQERPRILVTYHSATGNTQAMAEAVADGARSVEGVDVVVRSVEQATTEDLLASDAIVVGSPVYNANVAPEVQRFINGWPFPGKPLADKIGAAFATGGGISAGEELVQLNILHSMLIFGMIVVGGPDWTQPFGASAVTEELALDAAGSPNRAPDFLQKGFALGKRVAELCRRISQH
jgi:NAD(P)H dehydrogenase (quinone)